MNLNFSVPALRETSDNPHLQRIVMTPSAASPNVSQLLEYVDLFGPHLLWNEYFTLQHFTLQPLALQILT